MNETLLRDRSRVDPHRGKVNPKRLDKLREAINMEFHIQALGQIEVPWNNNQGSPPLARER